MTRKSLFIPFAAAAILVGLSSLDAQPAEAQYYGYGHPGYGGAPPPAGPGQWGFRHRIHGYLGGQAGGMFVLAQVTDYTEGYLSHGGGAGLFGGLRLGPFVSLELNWTISFHDDALTVRQAYLESLYLMTVTADVKIHIPTYGPVEPFFQAGVGFAYIGATYYDCAGCDSIFAKGPAFNVGGGLDFWLGPWFSVGGRILYRGLYFSEDAYGRVANAAKSNFVNGLSVDVNGTFHF